ncbi:M23 family metallopeptidase [Pseudalkalibacillus sp. SCS-8]|uniref:M23 family metallopeptidase n=1 Tax=Pseudalkalibacillus nanhaiensis TaxID=3115291 RepID=UPI0032DB8E8D
MGIGNTQRKKVGKMQRIALLTILAFTVGLFGFNSATYASDDRFELIKTVYHVYVDGENIGLVNEKNVVEDTKAQMIQKAEDRFKDIQLTVNEDIQYVPERIFNPDVDHEAVKKKLQDQLSIGILGAKLSFGGKTLGYFKTAEEAEEVVRELKLKYTDEKTLDKLQKQAEEKADSDKSGEQKEEKKSVEDETFSVSFDNEVQITSEKVSIDDLIDQEKAMERFKKGTLKKTSHKVKEDDTIESIVEKYDITREELFELNPDLSELTKLKEGEKLIVKEYKPFAKVVVKERVTKEHKIAYDSEVKEDDTMPKGESKISQKGKDGKKSVQYEITSVNGEVTDKNVVAEEVLSEPVTEIKIKGTKVIPSRGTGSFHWPTVGGYISSHKGQRWGRQHKGIDIARPSNRAILAVDNGTVVSAGFNSGGYGNRIIINHNNGFKSVYAHLASMNVSVGQTVKKGQKIGVMGSTGHSTGVHLHFELYKNGALLNPLKYISR